MSDKFNPYESDFGPGENPEFSVLIPISEIMEMLSKEKEEHSEEYLKRCPHCGNQIIFYKDDWFFCQEHNFIKLQ